MEMATNSETVSRRSQVLTVDYRRYIFLATLHSYRCHRPFVSGAKCYAGVCDSAIQLKNVPCWCVPIYAFNIRNNAKVFQY